MTMPELLLLTIGGVLIWASIQGTNPITMVKSVLTGDK